MILTCLFEHDKVLQTDVPERGSNIYPPTQTQKMPMLINQATILAYRSLVNFTAQVWKRRKDHGKVTK